MAHVVAAVCCLAIALLLVLSESAHAQAAKPTTPTQGETTPLSSTITDPTGVTTNSSSSSTLARTIVALLVVVAVIYGLAWILKQGKKKVAGSDDDYGAGLEPTAMLTLAGRTGLHLVKVGKEYLLLGVSDGGVNPIRSYTEDEARAAGFPMDDDDVDQLRPMSKDRQSLNPGTQLVERLRDLTVRR